MKTVLNSITAVILASTLVACGSSSSDDSSDTSTPVTEVTGFSYDATDLIENVTEQVIVDGYEMLNSKATVLHNATLTLLENKNEAALAAAQQAWKDARVFWEQGESHIFGPVDSLSIDPHLDTWPLNTADLEALLASNTTFSADNVKNFDDGVQGFHTMEFLLFGNGVEDNVKSIDEMTVREMEYLIACAEVFNIHTQSLVDAWVISANADDEPAYKDYLLTPGNDKYSSELGVIEELVNGVIGIVDEVGNGKIAEPFGTSKDTADTSLVESQYSWNSLTDFSNNIVGVQNVFLGTFSDENDSPGLKAFINAGDAELAAKVETQISAAIAAIDAIAGADDMPFRQAIKDDAGRVRIQTAIDALGELQATLEEEVVPLIKEWNL
ncbi:imelysin family protein [Pseudoalteromonas gelatinilytica]